MIGKLKESEIEFSSWNQSHKLYFFKFYERIRILNILLIIDSLNLLIYSNKISSLHFF